MLAAQQGFTLLAVIFAMLLLALGTQQVMSVASQPAQREREAELLRVGSAMATAIGAYYESSPGTIKRWPADLNDLVEDKRFVGLRRHVREVYADPVTRGNPWGLVLAADGGITGVYSVSDAAPVRTGTVRAANFVLGPASRYADWQFVYTPASAAPVAQP
jgi:type II secretory pathway pseudopilin PulG